MNASDEMNIVEMLREKTEEADLNKYLKKIIGGFTKKSVLDYLNLLRKQQLLAYDTFKKNLDDLYNEKNKIKNDNDLLLIKYNKLYAEYENLSQSLKDIKLEESTADDYINLKSNLVKLEEELKKSDRDKYTLERKIEQNNNDINLLQKELKQSKDEVKALEEMLKAERLETNKQRDTVADLSCMLEAEKDEVTYLKEKINEENIAKLNFTISQLQEQLNNQTEIIEKLNLDNSLKESVIKILKAEVEAINKNITELTKTIENLNIQNSKLLLTNDNLSNKLEEEYKSFVNLIKEKSGLSIDNIITKEKLNEAQSYISSLELQIHKAKFQK